MPNDQAFEFLTMPSRSHKPRQHGLTMTCDTGLGLSATEDVLTICAPYLDLWKLGYGTMCVFPKHLLLKKISLIRSRDIMVCPGGTLFEISEYDGKTQTFFDELIELNINTIELSSGTIDIKPNRLIKLITMAKKIGLTIFCEVGKKQADQDYDAKTYNELIQTFLAAGAHKVIIEARLSGKGVGIMDTKGNPQIDRLHSIMENIDASKIIFEAPTTTQQLFFLQLYGPETNLGNINPTAVVGLECLRKGLRSDTFEFFIKNKSFV